MIISHDRGKLIEIVKFFALHTKRLGKIKLFKLLYFLDFMHYKETGKSVTGLDYAAWPKGPVPVSLFNELKSPKSDWHGQVRFELEDIPTKGWEKLNIEVISAFDPKHFSKRELRIMRSIADDFRDALADDMIEATHLENSPWHQIYEVKGQRQAQIPYEMALRAQDKELMSEAIRDREEMLAVLRR